MRITPVLPVAALLAFAPSAHGSPLLGPFTPELPRVVIFSDGSVNLPIDLEGQCITVDNAARGDFRCTPLLPGEKRFFLKVGQIPRPTVPPSEIPQVFKFGETIIEPPSGGEEGGGVPDTVNSISGEISFFDGEQFVFSLPFKFSFGSVTFETTSTVFDFGGRQWMARTAGIGTAGNSTIEDAPDRNSGPFDLFMSYLPIDMQPISPVPEPAGAALVLLGLAGLAAIRRRR